MISDAVYFLYGISWIRIVLVKNCIVFKTRRLRGDQIVFLDIEWV